LPIDGYIYVNLFLKSKSPKKFESTLGMGSKRKYNTSCFFAMHIVAGRAHNPPTSTDSHNT